MLRIDIAGEHLRRKGKENKVVLLFHGLESDSRAGFSRSIVGGLVESGYTVGVLNNRGCGEGAKIALKSYHAGFIEDVRSVVRWAHDYFGGEAGKCRLYLAGFSLGANMLLNFLGKESGNVLKWSVKGAVCLSVPWDPTACQQKLDSSISRVLYSMRFVKSIQEKVKTIVDQGVEVNFDVDKVMSAKSIGEIDDEFVAKVFGFDGKLDYYNKTDARKMLKSIQVPTICYNARDDPFFAHQDLKHLPTSEMIDGAPVRVIVHNTGGHCGWFSFSDLSTNSFPYLTQEIVKFFDYLEAHQSRFEENGHVIDDISER